MIENEILTCSMIGDSSLGDRIIEQGVLEVISNELPKDGIGNDIISNKDTQYFVNVRPKTGSLDKFVMDITSLTVMFPDVKLGNFCVAYGYDGQCDLQFPPEIVEQIGRLGAYLLVSCYKVEGSDTLMGEE